MCVCGIIVSMNTQRKLPDRSELIRLRFENGLTLQEIGDKFKVSRERVRQVIGNTGRHFRSEWTFRHRNILVNENTTKQGIKNIKGVKSVLYKKLRSIHHRVDGDNTSRLGNETESLVHDRLVEMGIDNTLMPLRHPFDMIITKSGKTVDVKGSYSRRYTSPRQKSPMYSFHVRKDKKGDYCDFFIFYIEETDSILVIPNNEIGYVQNVYVTWPPSKRGWSKWKNFHNRFDLLEINNV